MAWCSVKAQGQLYLLRMIENSVLRRTIEPVKEEVTGLRKMHIKNINDSYSSHKLVWMIYIEKD